MISTPIFLPETKFFFFCGIDLLNKSSRDQYCINPLYYIFYFLNLSTDETRPFNRRLATFPSTLRFSHQFPQSSQVKFFQLLKQPEGFIFFLQTYNRGFNFDFLANLVKFFKVLEQTKSLVSPSIARILLFFRLHYLDR